jgi:hypothetical protein
MSAERSALLNMRPVRSHPDRPADRERDQGG